MGCMRMLLVQMVGLAISAPTPWAVADVPEPVRESLVFEYNLVARLNQDGISSLQPYPSINDHGIVAFVGRTGSGDAAVENVYTWGPDFVGSRLHPMFHSGLAPHADGGSPRQVFAADVQINNANQVLARRYLTARVQVAFPLGSILDAPLTYLELYDALTPNQYHVQQVAMGNGGYSGVTILNPLWAGWSTWGVGTPDLINIASAYDPATPFAGLLPWATLNNAGQTAFNALADQNYFMNRPGGGWIGAPLGSARLRTKLADNGFFVYRNTSASAVRIASYGFGTIIDIANTGSYQSVGALPGISDDGHVVAFAGSFKPDGRRAIFVSTDLGGRTFAQPLQIAGVAGNLQLEPGESYADLNENQAFDPQLGEVDEGTFADFELDSPVAVERMAKEGDEQYRVAFIATRLVRGEFGELQPRRGLHVLAIDVQDSVKPLRALGTVVKVGDRLPIDQAGTLLPGIVQDFGMHDPLNTLGNVAFWVKTSETEAILRTGTQSGELEIVDYNAPEFRGEPTCQKLLSRGNQVKGLTADGVTKLLIRTPGFDLPGTFELTVAAVEDGSVLAEHAGILEDPFSARKGNPLVTELARCSGPTGRNQGYFLLTAPKDFVRSETPFATGDATLRGSSAPRKLKLTGRYYPNFGSEAVTFERIIELHRPPVVLVHGLHDRGASWNWSIQRDPRFRVHVMDYEGSNGDEFVKNVPRVRSFIRSALSRVRSEGIAATQVDAFGHSMGGVLLRLYSTDELISGMDTDYKNEWNFRRGDLHKLVTVNSPLWGSPIAPQMANLDGTTTWAGWAAPFLVSRVFMDLISGGACGVDKARCMDCGAVRDLRPDSDIMIKMNAVRAPVPVHAIYGVGGDTADSPAEYGSCKRALMQLPAETCLSRDYLPSDLFQEDSDTVVPESSQRAGLSVSATTRVEGGEGLHYPTINEYPSGRSAMKAVELLNATVDGPMFEMGFPVRRTSPLIPFSPPLCLVSQVQDWAKSLEELLEMGAGGAGGFAATVSPGSVLRLPVAIPAGAIVTQAMVISESPEIRTVNLQQAVEVSIPISWHGSFSCMVIARLNDGRLIRSPEVRVWVQSQDLPEAIAFSGENRDLYVGEPPPPLHLIGRYPGGIERELGGAFGVTYASLRTNVATVDPNGFLSPLAPGRTAITARFGPLTAVIDVTVMRAEPIDQPITFGQWALRLPEGQRSYENAPFGDGVQNLARYTFGITPEPNADLSNLPRVVVDGTSGTNWLRLDYRVGKNGNPDQVGLSRSVDLRTWTEIRPELEPPGTLSIQDRGYHWRFPLTDKLKFYRVAIKP